MLILWTFRYFLIVFLLLLGFVRSSLAAQHLGQNIYLYVNSAADYQQAEPEAE